MDPDPTITVSFDYLVELTDDGTEPGQGEPEVFILPPPAQDGIAPADFKKAAEQGPQP